MPDSAGDRKGDRNVFSGPKQVSETKRRKERNSEMKVGANKGGS